MALTNEDNIYTLDRMIKFDGEAFLPIKFDNGSTYQISNMKTMKFKMWYLTKKDGTNGNQKMKRKIRIYKI